jgi:hypothetical protein
MSTRLRFTTSTACSLISQLSKKNQHAIEEFLTIYSTGWGLDLGVSGTYNLNEPVFEQVLEVARHKLQDANAAIRLAIKQFLNDDPDPR